MAYKDEYEVARLYTDGAFVKKLSAQFDGDFTLEYHLAPPLLARRDPVTGEPRKLEFGAMDASCVPAAGVAARPCAAPRSTFSATPRSARWSAA